MRLVAELRRRNVLRMAGLYLVGAWLTTQVASTLLPAFEAPPWALRVVILVLAIGFFAALIFAWAFELTPEGLKRDEGEPGDNPIAPQTARRLDRAMIVVLLFALGYFAFDKFVLAPRREAALLAQATGDAAASAPAKVNPRSIAVLPFVNMSTNAENEFFSDGISEEILNREIGLIRDAKLRELAMHTYTADVFNEVIVNARGSQYRIAFRKAIPRDVQTRLNERCGDRIVPIGDYTKIDQVLDYPCTTELPAAAIAASVAILRADPNFAATPRLRIADLGTDLSNFTWFYKDDLRDRLRALAKEAP